MDVIGLAAEALKPISDEGTIVQQGWYDERLCAAFRKEPQCIITAIIIHRMERNGYTLL